MLIRSISDWTIRKNVSRNFGSAYFSGKYWANVLIADKGWYDSVTAVTKETKEEVGRVVLGAYQEEQREPSR